LSGKLKPEVWGRSKKLLLKEKTNQAYIYTLDLVKKVYPYVSNRSWNWSMIHGYAPENS